MVQVSYKEFTFSQVPVPINIVSPVWLQFLGKSLDLGAVVGLTKRKYCPMTVRSCSEDLGRDWRAGCRLDGSWAAVPTGQDGWHAMIPKPHFRVPAFQGLPFIAANQTAGEDYTPTCCHASERVIA
ncbi:Hypothetical predicted protein, partial [Pelobates cultripes]